MLGSEGGEWRSSRTNEKAKTVVVVKRRKKTKGKNIAWQTACRPRQRCKSSKSPLTTTTTHRQAPLPRHGLPTFEGDIEKAIQDDESQSKDDDDDDLLLLLPLEDDIPCDTLLALQSLLQHQQQNPATATCSCLAIPLETSCQPVWCVLDAQLYQILQSQHQDQDHADASALVARELDELVHKNVVRRLESVRQPAAAASGGGSSIHLSVLVLTEDYIRGAWDILDARYSTAGDDDTDDTAEKTRLYIQWFVDHLQCWTTRALSQAQLERVWRLDPPRHANNPLFILSLHQCLETLQSLQVLLPNNNLSLSSASHHEHAAFQLWLPQWGQAIAAVQKAQQSLVAKLKRSMRQELSEASLQQQPYYKHVPIHFLLTHLSMQGLIYYQTKPFGRFVRLLSEQQDCKKQRGR